MADSTVFDHLRAMLTDHHPIDGSIEQDTLLADLGLDSLDTIELVTEIEDKFDIVIPDEDITESLVTNVGQVVNYIEEKLKERKAS